MNKITLRHVAEQAGVSVSTVSCVLNGKGAERGITEETADTIREVVSRLHYIKHPGKQFPNTKAAHNYHFFLMYLRKTGRLVFNEVESLEMIVEEYIKHQNKQNG